jgi:hypothetical protein
VLCGLLGAALVRPAGAGAETVVLDVDSLLPGEYSWRPELSPSGPVAIVVSIPAQLVHVYRNGIRFAVSTCSTGKSGHATPTGVFTILQKDAHHHSSTYGGAPMPNMNRLTWDGIALHAGNLPGYPASHGCVRLPIEFSAKLFEVTHVGTPVVIGGSASDPFPLVHPGFLLDGITEQEVLDAAAALEAKTHPSDWEIAPEYPITTVIVTGADRRAALREEGVEILEDGVGIDGAGPLGEHVLVLDGADEAGGLRWTALTHHEDEGRSFDTDLAVLDRLRLTPAFRAAVNARLHPGLTLVVSDLAAHPDRRSAADFTIMEGAMLDVPPPLERPRG